MPRDLSDPVQRKAHYEASKAWWKAHPEKLREKERRRRKTTKWKQKQKRNRIKHAAEIKVKKAAWQKKRKHHLRDYLKKYYRANKEKLKARSRQWYQENRGRALAHIVKRRLKEGAAPLEDVVIINQWIKEIRSKPFVRCHWCGTKVAGKHIHFDHIIPLGKNGDHSIANLCAACPDCNMEKHARMPSDWSVSGQTFLNL